MLLFSEYYFQPSTLQRNPQEIIEIPRMVTDTLNVDPIPDVYYKFDAMQRSSQITEKKKFFKQDRVALKQKNCKGYYKKVRPIVQPRKIS